MYHKGLWLGLVTQMGKSPNDSIKLLSISRVIEFWALNFALKLANGNLAWVRTTQMPMPLASHSTSKRCSKLRRAKIGIKHNFLLTVSKALWVAFVYSKLSFFMHSVN